MRRRSNLDVLAANAAGLDPAVARMAVVLLILGYGTKAGLVPFHTWLPDAHSQAPAPVSALMSGVLLAVAFYVILRVKAIADVTLGPFPPHRCWLALASLLVAALLIATARLQADARLLQHRAHGAARERRRGGPRSPPRAVLLHMLGSRPRRRAPCSSAPGTSCRPQGTSQIATFRVGHPRTGDRRLLRPGVLALIGFPPFSDLRERVRPRPRRFRCRPRMAHRDRFRCYRSSSSPPWSGTPAGCCSAPHASPAAPDDGAARPHRRGARWWSAVAARSRSGSRAARSTELFTTAARHMVGGPMTTARRPPNPHQASRRTARTLSPDERPTALLDAGFRVALMPDTTTATRLRVVYLFLAAAPDRRVELTPSLPRPSPRSPAWRAVVPRRPVRARDARPVRHPPGRPPTAARLVRHSTGPGLVPDARRRRARTGLRRPTARTRSASSRAPGSTRYRSARCTPA